MKTAAIMISRQPQGKLESPWLKAASEAVLWAGKTAYSPDFDWSEDLEMVLFRNRYGVSCRIFLMADSEDDFRERSQWVRRPVQT